MSKVAIVTGGASGLGLALAKELAQKNWHVHILDTDSVNGAKQASYLTNAKFHHVCVTDWSGMSATFDEIFTSEGRLDFVFANAGLLEKPGIWSKHSELTEPIPEPVQLCIDEHLRGCVNASYLAHQCFMKNTERVDANLICTGSVCSLFSDGILPLYVSSKHGMLGFVQDAAKTMEDDGIRVNAVIPGALSTSMTGDGKDIIAESELLQHQSYMVSVIMMILSGKGGRDANGQEVLAGEMHGKALEINKDQFFFRDQPKLAGDTSCSVMTLWRE